MLTRRSGQSFATPLTVAVPSVNFVDISPHCGESPSRIETLGTARGPRRNFFVTFNFFSRKERLVVAASWLIVLVSFFERGDNLKLMERVTSGGSFSSDFLFIFYLRRARAAWAVTFGGCAKSNQKHAFGCTGGPQWRFFSLALVVKFIIVALINLVLKRIGYFTKKRLLQFISTTP